MDIQQLQLRALAIRQDIVTMLQEAGSGHVGGALGLADVFSALYFQELVHRPDQPEWEGRDRLVLSPGHTAAVRYAAMAESGYFERRELLTLRRLGSRLQGHPHNRSLPGTETSSGPLGQGLSQALGMALAARMDKASWHTYAVLSDGEHQEGQIWEAIMFAGNKRLDSLTAIIDRNCIQIGGRTEDEMPLEPLADKYRAFGWNVLDVDGNDMAAVVAALQQARAHTGAPTCVIARTVPGKGVSYMENDYRWHSHPMTAEQYDQAISELTPRA